MKILDPRTDPRCDVADRQAVMRWRAQVLRPYLFDRRGWLCERCWQATPTDLDEAVVTRGDGVGLPDQGWAGLFCEVNVRLCCPRCNRESAHWRDEAWRLGVKEYGLEVMQTWLASLGFKVPPRMDWLSHDRKG